MSAAPERVDLGALGCTRDGYQLIGVGLLASVGAMVVSLGPMAGFEAPWGTFFGWLGRIAGWISLAGSALVVLGIAATAATPHGPFPLWIKRLVAVAYAVSVVSSPLWNARPFQGDGWSFYLQRFGEGLMWVAWEIRPWTWLVAMVLLCGCSAWFALRHRVFSAAFAWVLLGGWYLGVSALPWMWFEGWSQYAFVLAVAAGCFAPLYLARRLRLAIHAAAGARP